MNRREFLLSAFKSGGMAALFSLGLSFREAELFASTAVSGRPCPGGVAGCVTPEDSVTEDATGYEVGIYDSMIWIATKLIVNTTYICCGVKIPYTQTGTPNSTITLCIYDNNSTVPGSQVGDCSSAIAESAIIANGLTYIFSVNASLSAGTYWIVQKRAAPDSSNFLVWKKKTGYSEGAVATAYNPTTWTAGLNSQLGYITYK